MTQAGLAAQLNAPGNLVLPTSIVLQRSTCSLFFFFFF